MLSLRRILALFALVSVLLPLAHAAAADAVIDQARRYVGKDRDLDGVRSLHYRCRLEVSGAMEASGTLEILLQKPCLQKTIRVIGDRREIVGLDDTEAWMRVESVAKPALSRTDVLPVAQLRLLRANALENLAFYRGLEKFGGSVELRGETTHEGRAATKVAFLHPGGIVFLRTFDKADGRLLVTEGPGGELIREEGEKLVGGIRFPERLVSTGKTQDGAPVVVSIVFEEIVVNAPVAADAFALPMPTLR